MSGNGRRRGEDRQGALSRRETVAVTLAAVSLALIVAGLFFLGAGRMADAVSSPPTTDLSGGPGVEYTLEWMVNAASGALLSFGSALCYACTALYIFSPAGGRVRTVTIRAASWAALAVLAGLALPGIPDLAYYYDPITVAGARADG